MTIPFYSSTNELTGYINAAHIRSISINVNFQVYHEVLASVHGSTFKVYLTRDIGAAKNFAKSLSTILFGASIETLHPELFI